MRLLRRMALGLLAAIAVARAVAFLVYAGVRIALPAEVWHLEPKMVLLAWRVQHGHRFYPSWTDYPHVSNFFGPVYFAMVGGLGRLFGADLAGLAVIGRSVTLASGLATSAALGFWAAKAGGRFVGVIVAALTLGSGAMIGYGLMVRPDAMAGLLGTVGLLLAVEGGGRRRGLAAILLLLAIFTKQTAALYLIAAGAAVAAEGRWRAASGLVIAVAAAAVAIAMGVTIGFEPMFAPSLLGEAKTPYRLGDWAGLLSKLMLHSPDLIVLPVFGLIVWKTQRPKTVGKIAAAVVLLAGDVGSALKYGSDLNYFLDLRVIQAWACASLIASRADRPRLALGLIVASAVAVIPGLAWAVSEAHSAIRLASFYETPKGLEFLAELRALEATVADPSLRVLADSSYLQARRGERAEFGDPWLFRAQVDAGLVVPAKMEDALDRGCYDLVVTLKDLFAPRDPDDANSLPRSLTYRARQRYRFTRRQAGLFVYERIGPPDPDCRD